MLCYSSHLLYFCLCLSTEHATSFSIITNFQDEKESPENVKVCKITAEERNEMPEKIKEAQEEILEKSGDGKQKL